MATKHDIVNMLPANTKVCFVIRKLFTAHECQLLLQQTMKDSFQKAIDNYPTSYPNNDRFVTDDNQFAVELFDRVKSYLPKIMTIESESAVESGSWELQELNRRIRYCRYSAGQYFNRHLDGVHYRSQKVQS